MALTIPKEALEEYGNETVRLQFVSYRSGKFFQSRRHLIPGQPSLVLSATVGHRPVYGLYEPVVYSMPLAVNSSFYSCVYWNETGKKTHHLIRIQQIHRMVLNFRERMVHVRHHDAEDRAGND